MLPRGITSELSIGTSRMRLKQSPRLNLRCNSAPKAMDYRYQLGTVLHASVATPRPSGNCRSPRGCNRNPQKSGWLSACRLRRAARYRKPKPHIPRLSILIPATREARNALGFILVQTRQAEKGIEEFRKVLEADPNDVDADDEHRLCVAAKGRVRQGCHQFRTVLVRNPESIVARYDLGLALKQMDQLPEAISEFKEAIRLDPQLVEAYYTLGVTYWQLGDFEHTIEAMRTAVRLRPEYAQAHYMLGTALKQQGNLDEAITALQTSIRLDPEDPGPHNTLGQILRTRGDAAEAKQRSLKALKSRLARRRSRRRCWAPSTVANSGLAHPIRASRERSTMAVTCSGPLCRTMLWHSPEEISSDRCAQPQAFSLWTTFYPRRVLPFQFVNIAREAGLRAKTIYGGEAQSLSARDHRLRRRVLRLRPRRLARYFPGQRHALRSEVGARRRRRSSRLYKNNRDGTFTDVTLKAGLARTGWGQGCCVGDYDNDGCDDLFVTYWGDCVLYRNNGNGNSSMSRRKAGVTTRTDATG